MDSPSGQFDEHVLHVQQLFIQEQPQLRAFVRSLVPDFSAADDLVQETFLEVTRKAQKFQRGTNFRAWVRQIARFKILSRVRDYQRRPLAVLSEEVLESLIASAPEPGSGEEREHRVSVLRDCIEELAPKAREIVRLRYFGEHLPGEISKLLDQSANGINVTLSRARVALRKCVEENLNPS